MAIVTLGLMTERVRRYLASGYPSTSDRTQDEEIRLSIGNAANTVLKAEMFATTYAVDGESIPSGAMIATYENIPVTRGLGSTANIKLPAAPMYIPERMGLFSLYPSGRPDLEFAPIPPGTINLLRGDKMMNPLARKFYTWENMNAVVFDDLVGAGISSVDMKIVIMDVNQYEDNMPLPISPDQEMLIMNQVIQFYTGEPMHPRTDSNQPAA